MRAKNSYRVMLVRPSILGAAMLLMLGHLESIQAQGAQIASPGSYTVGSKLSEVRLLKQSENCLIEGNNADCTFTDGSGVSYIVLEDSVTTVTVTASTAAPGVKLPFSLKFGDGLDVAARKVVAGGGRWTLIGDPDTSTDIVLISREKYFGKNGWRFNVEIQFRSGRLVRVSYSSGTI